MVLEGGWVYTSLDFFERERERERKGERENNHVKSMTKKLVTSFIKVEKNILVGLFIQLQCPHSETPFLIHA